MHANIIIGTFNLFSVISAFRSVSLFCVCMGSHCTALLSPHRKISVKFPDPHSRMRDLELEGQATDKLGLDIFYQVNCCSLMSIMQIRIRV